MFGDLLGGLLGGIGSLFGGSATKKAAAANNKALDGYLKSGTAAIDTGQQQAQDYLGGVGNLWSNLAKESGGLSGLNLLGDALGVNGAAGNANATSAFQTSPGYEFQQQQGIDALNRSAAARGQLNSGQTGLDTLTFSQGLANNEYQNWLNSLSGFSGQQGNIYTGATTGQAGALSDLANLATGTAGQKVSLLGDVTNGRLGANNQTAAGTQQQLGGLSGFGQGLGALFGGYL
ncbi:hypothetical protein [Mesorhizobium sp. B2-3-2]|uniref:hypothetical protein n=1 Tax=Mesorhizobium sp. B2-3-2 TaxID=2589961 RepID=UPI00112D25A2|nr:hypothetical protein [Mesorhizobium sp. B2-3-2]TPM37052.1 hypothetical protein FJ964_30425 [Mesorhizobium sp. B2-3-2]